MKISILKTSHKFCSIYTIYSQLNTFYSVLKRYLNRVKKKMINSNNCRNWITVIYLLFAAIISTKLEVMQWKKIIADNCEVLWYPNSVRKLIFDADDQRDGTNSVIVWWCTFDQKDYQEYNRWQQRNGPFIHDVTSAK